MTIAYGCSNVVKLNLKKKILRKKYVCMIFTKSFFFKQKLFV